MSETDTAPGRPPEKADKSPIWKRGGIALLFLVAFQIAQWLLVLTAVVQFAAHLITGRPIVHLESFGRSLAIWLAEVTGFLSYATETRPFPFSPWPRAD
jgi:hypothetical protein